VVLECKCGVVDGTLKEEKNVKEMKKKNWVDGVVFNFF